MSIPKYVQEMMKRAEFALGIGAPDYTIRISKRTPYTRVETLKKEVERLKKWVDKQVPGDDLVVPVMVIHYIPQKTRYGNQSAMVTIYDPVMQKIEKFITKEA